MLTGCVVFLLRCSMRSALIFSSCRSNFGGRVCGRVEVMRHVRRFAEGHREKVHLKLSRRMLLVRTAINSWLCESVWCVRGRRWEAAAHECGQRRGADLQAHLHRHRKSEQAVSMCRVCVMRVMRRSDGAPWVVTQSFGGVSTLSSCGGWP